MRRKSDGSSPGNLFDELAFARSNAQSQLVTIANAFSRLGTGDYRAISAEAPTAQVDREE